MCVPRFIKISKITHPINWWNQDGVLGEMFEVLDISPEYGYFKIEYEKDVYGWIPPEVCEINPHLRRVK